MSILEEFKKFAMRGNLVDLASGFTVGAAFSTVAKSLVNDVIMPPIGLLLGGMDFSDLYWVLKEGDQPLAPDATLATAESAGAVTLNYGVFINNVIALLLVAVVMFLLIRMMNKLDEALEDDKPSAKTKDATPANKKCPYCKETIVYEATRCKFCTSELSQPGS